MVIIIRQIGIVVMVCRCEKRVVWGLSASCLLLCLERSAVKLFQGLAGSSGYFENNWLRVVGL